MTELAPENSTNRVRHAWQHPAFRRARDVAWWVLIVVLAIVVYRRFAPATDLEVIGPAPPLEMATIDGDDVNLADLRGQIVVLNVWATWCPPCRVETPGFVRLQREFESRVRFLGLSTDDDLAAVREFVSRYNVNYPILVGRNRAGAGYNVPVLPTTFVIDGAGRIRFQHEGLILAHALRRIVTDLLNE